MEFKIKTENFEGDIETLIKLMKKREIEPDKINLYEIVSELISSSKIASLEDAGDLIVVLSNLLEAKSSLVLPVSPSEDETEELESDIELAKKIMEEVEEYKKFKGIALEFKKLEDFIHEFFPREIDETQLPSPDTSEVFLGENVTLYDLVSSLKTVLHRAKARTVEIPREILTLEEAKEIILSICSKKLDGVNFSELFSPDATRIEIIVIFLALLELTKQKQIRIKQEGQFEEIRIYGEKGDKKYN